MGRGALKWTVKTLAEATDLAPNTILAFESGRSTRDSTAHRIMTVFEENGVRFTATEDGLVVTLETPDA